MKKYPKVLVDVRTDDGPAIMRWVRVDNVLNNIISYLSGHGHRPETVRNCARHLKVVRDTIKPIILKSIIK